MKSLPAILAAIVLIGLLLISQDETRITAAPDGEKPFPDFSMPTLGGENWRLSNQRGHITLLNFWATWCPPCREETPDLVQLSDDYRSRGVIVVGIAMDGENQIAIRSFVNQFRMRYPILLPAPETPMLQAIDALPTTLLLDDRGRRVVTYQGILPVTAVRREFDRLLAASQPSQAVRPSR